MPESDATPAPDPAKVRRKLMRWYRSRGRDFFWREGSAAIALAPFQVLLVEFLLWKTNAARSHEKIRELVERYSSPAAVLADSTERIEDELRPLGLFRRRAHCLTALSQQLTDRHGGEVPRDPDTLAKLTGVGQYGARATACLLRGSRLMPVDANTARIFGRLLGREGPPVRKPGADWDELMLAFVPERNPKRFLWATMDLGAACCVARQPRCDACPLRKDCLTARAASQN